MLSLTKLIKYFILSLVLIGFNSVQAENLYECELNGKSATYHENDAKRMQLLGAECRIMHPIEEITCSMNGVRVNYSREEAEALLAKYPKATCEINDQLFIAFVQTAQRRPLSLVKKLVIYFPINGKRLSQSSRNLITAFAKRHRSMGYSFTITGHASATGSASKNHTLSLQRAGVVRDAMLNSGVNENNIISVDALGEESLRYRTQYEERRNRAVVIKAYGR
jgi:outer membrane protein OmpA-like peptidoglycan-associated protein